MNCNTTKKYQMPNMSGDGKYIDVSKLVLKEGYKPIYSTTNNEICALINPHPLKLDSFNEVILKQKINDWLNVNYKDSDSTYIILYDICDKSAYQYSYIIKSKLIDVYKVVFEYKSIKQKIYFRLDENQIILPINDTGWVFW